MKCPYRKIVMKTECGIEEDFADCYEYNCPLYEPETKLGNILVKASCVRADKEWK